MKMRRNGRIYEDDEIEFDYEDRFYNDAPEEMKPIIANGRWHRYYDDYSSDNSNRRLDMDVNKRRYMSGNKFNRQRGFIDDYHVADDENTNIWDERGSRGMGALSDEPITRNWHRGHRDTVKKSYFARGGNRLNNVIDESIHYWVNGVHHTC